MPYVSFYGRLSFVCFSKNLRFSIKMLLIGCKSMDTFGCMSMPFGCMSMDRLGACIRLLGAKSAATFGCMPDSR